MTDVSDDLRADTSAPDRRHLAFHPMRPEDVTAKNWQTRHAWRLAITDFCILAATMLVAVVVRFGFDSSALAVGSWSLGYIPFALIIGAAWFAGLHFQNTRAPSVIGAGSEEYRRVLRVSFMVFGVLAIVSVLIKLDFSRGFLAIAFPMGTVGLLLGRKAWRVWLSHERERAGSHMSNVLVVGGKRSARDVARWLNHERSSGYRVTGVWVPDHEGRPNEWLDVPDHFIPVMGNSRRLRDAIRLSEANAVVVTDTEHLGHHGLKDLTWKLEGTDIELLVSPNVIDVASSRIELTQLARMPFLSVEKPTYREAAAWPKKLFDLVGSGAIVVLLSPLLLATAIAVKLTSAGPIFYRQERIGIDGNPFGMLKFRSMRVDADQHLAALVEAQGGELGKLPKIVNDPRITTVGRFIRRFSIDELPQLFNVLRGDMSLVGPRPQRQFEVDLYDDVAHRRLRVRPGMTGLWQVSGRSDLSWDDAIRLDTYYVENWSLISDIQILWRTIRAVFTRDGAY